MPDDLLTVSQVANRFNVSQVTVYRWATGEPPELPSVRIGGVLRFRREDVEERIAKKAK